MFKQASSGTSGVEIIFIILLGLLFLSQTLGKLIMWLWQRFHYTAFAGKEIIEELQSKNHLEDSKIKVRDIDLRSSFYAYKRKGNEFFMSKSIANRSDLASNLYSLKAVAYANEKHNRTFHSRWQFIGCALLSVVPYLFFMGTMLLIYLPYRHMSYVGNPLALKYYLPVEIMCVLGWVFILLSIFWWMSIVGNIEIAVEDLSKQLDNRNILAATESNLKICSYIPFSFRTII